MTKTTQIRGNCQCCAKEQAVVGGLMSKHGYTVDHGWFNGVCSGNRYQPMQVSRLHADSIISDIRLEIPKLLAKADQLEVGTLSPEFVSKYVFNAETRKREAKLIPFAEATSWDQDNARHQAVYALRSRARSGEQFANQLETLANKVHGTALLEVAKKEVVAIQIGEKKTSKETNLVYTCFKVEGARVWWTSARASDGKILKSWMGSTAWRKLETV